MSRVSIIVPVYNVSHYLKQCLDSIQAQTFIDWTAILIDDGSTDDSGKICDVYVAKDKRFRVVHQKNAGAANAKNHGLDCVETELTAFIDSDDYVEPTWLESVINTMDSSSADIVEYNYDNLYKTYNEKNNIYKKEYEEFDAERYLGQYLENWTCSLFWNKVFKTELIDDIRFRKERRCIDDEFFTYKVVSGARKIVRIDKVLYHYRQRRSGAVNNYAHMQQIADDSLEVLIERYQWIKRYFPAIKKKYLQHDISILFYFAKQPHNENTIRKFRSIAKFYLKEALFCFAGRVTLMNAFRLQFISDKSLSEDLEQQSREKDMSELFD